ncbi:MAG: heparinase II/III family protein [Pseudomonadota bacterium]
MLKTEPKARATRKPADPAAEAPPGLVALSGLAVRRAVAVAVGRLGGALWHRTLTGTPGRIVFAPETVTAADPDIAADIYAGVFSLAGRTVDTQGQSPFTVAPPTLDWAAELHSFSWLVHLDATPSALSTSNAVALLDEWVAAPESSKGVAVRPGIVAERLTAFLVMSPVLLDGADNARRLAFMRLLGRHMRRLERAVAVEETPLTALRVIGALALAGTVIADQARLQRWALAVLGDTLKRQILPDGGHKGRAPDAVVSALSILVPLKLALERRQQTVPKSVSGSIDKLFPMLRFFAHADGALAVFQGSRNVAADEVATLLALDDAKGRPTQNARYSLYQRLAAGPSVALFDMGVLPPPAFAERSSAGVLAIEFSSGGQRIVTGCGPLSAVDPGWAVAARMGAAASTLTIDNRSPARLLRWPVLTRVFGAIAFAGPGRVDIARKGLTASARHDGYLPRFGVTHERALELSDDGLALTGHDRLIGQDRLSGTPFAIRFHLMPKIAVRVDKARQNAMLTLPDGAIWLFQVRSGPALAVEETIVATAPGRARRAAQIVIHGNTLTDERVSWQIARRSGPLSESPP